MRRLSKLIPISSPLNTLKGMSSITELEIALPDDFHHHLRDGDVLENIVHHASRSFGRVVVMPNIKPPVRNLDEAMNYRDRILAHVPSGSSFTTMMTIYLTDFTTDLFLKQLTVRRCPFPHKMACGIQHIYIADKKHPKFRYQPHTFYILLYPPLLSEEIIRSFKSGHVFAAKLYPAGATTNSEFGVSNIEKVYTALQTMSDVGMPLLVHGEVTDSNIDIFDRERVFIDTILRPVMLRFPLLRIVMEHITTEDAVNFILIENKDNANIAATITAHHLLYNRNDIFKGGVCPHMFCLPILKREKHRISLLNAATSGSTKFFIGTDSAPHTVTSKESACGCAGIFTGHAAIELYAEAFDSVNALHLLEGFLSVNGQLFYKIQQNTQKIKLIKESWNVPQEYSFGSSVVRPLRAGESVAWRFESI